MVVVIGQAKALVRTPPSSTPHAAIVRPPIHGMVWSPGYYRWRGGRYRWIPSWVLPAEAFVNDWQFEPFWRDRSRFAKAVMLHFTVSIGDAIRPAARGSHPREHFRMRRDDGRDISTTFGLRLSRARWLGTVMITAGAAVVGLTQSNTTAEPMESAS